jgi:hypothetical protein
MDSVGTGLGVSIKYLKVFLIRYFNGESVAVCHHRTSKERGKRTIKEKGEL